MIANKQSSGERSTEFAEVGSPAFATSRASQLRRFEYLLSVPFWRSHVFGRPLGRGMYPLYLRVYALSISRWSLAAALHARAPLLLLAPSF